MYFVDFYITMEERTGRWWGQERTSSQYSSLDRPKWNHAMCQSNADNAIGFEYQMFLQTSRSISAILYASYIWIFKKCDIGVDIGYVSVYMCCYCKTRTVKLRLLRIDIWGLKSIQGYFVHLPLSVYTLKYIWIDIHIKSMSVLFSVWPLLLCGLTCLLYIKDTEHQEIFFFCLRVFDILELQLQSRFETVGKFRLVFLFQMNLVIVLLPDEYNVPLISSRVTNHVTKRSLCG